MVNHKNFANKMTHPYPNRRFVPQAVLTRSSKINTAGAAVNIVRPVNTVVSKPTLNRPRPISNTFKSGHSNVIRSFNKNSSNKNSIVNKKVNTVSVNDTTARERTVVSENKEKEVNVVKDSACWSNPQQKEYKEKAVIDSGCSRHMTGNKCYLTEYEDYDGGFVSFRDGKGRISRKATKDETSGILKTFITGIENQLDYKVKVIRCDNGIEFKNSIMNQFYEMKGIKREFSVVERKNRTLIEVARTMRPPLIDFMKPFGYPVTILNTRDHLGKFDEKADEGFFVGYSMVSKAVRVFNKRTRIVKETLNIIFLENAPNVKGNGPDWLFDVDSLTISMNYVPVITGNQTNGIAGNRDNIVAGQAKKKIEPEQEYILITLCTTDPSISQDPKDREVNARKKAIENEHINSTNSINTVSTVGPSFANAAPSSSINAAVDLLLVSSIDNTGIFGNAYDDEDLEEEVDMNNVISSYSVPDTSFTKFHKDHPEDQVIGSLKTPV
ncbi:ribonuclease H-like domain-containing protein [Tanacetum coccineum]